MNYIKILCFSAVITGLGSIVSCGDAKYDTLDTHAYIEEALSSTPVHDWLVLGSVLPSQSWYIPAVADRGLQFPSE